MQNLVGNTHRYFCRVAFRARSDAGDGSVSGPGEYGTYKRRLSMFLRARPRLRYFTGACCEPIVVGAAAPVHPLTLTLATAVFLGEAAG